MLDDARFLSENERKALVEFKRRVGSRFPGSTFTLFGSKARGDFGPDSDIDLLVVTERELSWREVDSTISDAYEVNLAHGALFTVHVVSRAEWDEGRWTCFPLRESVERDGISV